MKQIGLALSGGGFRASIYHLGVLRFLRDAGILPQITHITSVSGGSITAAHLVLNWDRYCGSESEFEKAADELIRFTRLDVRNRIVRRFPLGSLANSFRRIVRMSPKRGFTRPGMLESYYRRHLYGDKSLFQLPSHPRLHMLATSLSEGCLCSFFDGGLLLQRRQPGQGTVFEQVDFGLGTVPMAVAASSAFPGFFPPLEVSGWDVGTAAGDFDTQVFTDGGVIDNLGLRMFRCIEESWLLDETPIAPQEVDEVQRILDRSYQESDGHEAASLARLRHLLLSVNLARDAEQPLPTGGNAAARSLWELIRTAELYRDTQLLSVQPENSSAQSLLNYARNSDVKLEPGDHIWLNREIVNQILKESTGEEYLSSTREGFHRILVSDASAQFQIKNYERSAGLIATAMRSSDIAMDRVYQLELENFRNSEGVVFFPMSAVIPSAQDPTAPHPEIQRQVSRIRTDLDRFSDLEIASLIQHGYCITRQYSKELIAELEATMPTGKPWCPQLSGESLKADTDRQLDDLSDKSQAMGTARKLQRSSQRRIWGTLLSFRDPLTYFWAPLVLAILFALPYMWTQLQESSYRQQLILTAISETSPLYNELLETIFGETETDYPPVAFEEVDTLQPPDASGIEILSYSYIFDLRNWGEESAAPSRLAHHERVLVRRSAENSEQTEVRFQISTPDEDLNFEMHPKRLKPKFYRMALPDGNYAWELSMDFSEVPLNEDVEMVIDGYMPSNRADEDAEGAYFDFPVHLDAGLVQVWMLMPEDRQFHNLRINGYSAERPDFRERIVPNEIVQLPLGSLVTFQLINPAENSRYECRWEWDGDDE